MKTRHLSIPHTRGWGIGMALMTAVISGFAIFINSYGVSSWVEAGSSSATYTTAKNMVAALALGAMLFFVSRRRSGEGLTRPTRPGQWIGLAAVGLFGGSVPFLLFFEGLARADSVQAALLHKTLFLWVAVLAVTLLRERLGLGHVAALALLVAGQVSMAGGIAGLGFGAGEVMILSATLLWSIEVVVAKRLLGDLSALTVGTARMGLGVVVLVGYGVFSGALGELGSVGLTQLGWVMLTGAILTAYVVSWYAGLARAQAVDVTAVLVLGAVITAGLRSGIQGADLSGQGWGLILVTVGVAVFVLGRRRDRVGVPG